MCSSDLRAFLGRAVRFLLTSGIRQFIDLGSGLPTQENVHEIAQRADPEARVVYVDNDPAAIAHSRHLVRGNTLATVIEADLRDTDAVTGHPDVTSLIDFGRPVGLLTVGVLHFVPDADDPAGVVGKLAAVLASGSFLALSHATDDAVPGIAAQVEELYTYTTAAAHTRTSAEIMRFFEGFELVEPGLTYLPLWRPGREPPANPEQVWSYAGVGRKR